MPHTWITHTISPVEEVDNNFAMFSCYIFTFVYTICIIIMIFFFLGGGLINTLERVLPNKNKTHHVICVLCVSQFV